MNIRESGRALSMTPEVCFKIEGVLEIIVI